MQSVQTKQVPGKAEIIINPFDFSNNLYGMEGDAKLVINQQEDPLPYGWFRIDITNYDTLIDYLVTMYNVMTASIAEAAAQSGGAIVVGIRELNQEDITAFKAFLQKVFTFSNDGKDIKLVFQREKGKEFYIGNYPIVQTIVIFQESIMQVQERARKAAEKAQQEAEEAAAAAAANDNQAEETEEKPVDEGITASEAVQ